MSYCLTCQQVALCGLIESLASCRYEMEEDPDVCQAMERTAELFLEGGDAIEEFEA